MSNSLRTESNLSKYEKQFIAMRYWLLGKSYYKAIEALELAANVHNGLRRDGSKEFSHQLSIAHYLKTISTSIEYPEETLIIGILHDSLEDEKLQNIEILERFGEEVSLAVRELSKFYLDTKQKKTDEIYYERIATNRSASIVKGADRIHNLETMQGAFSKEKKEIYLQETERFVLPMLKQARRNFPKQELTYQNIKYVLENQVKLLRLIPVN